MLRSSVSHSVDDFPCVDFVLIWSMLMFSRFYNRGRPGRFTNRCRASFTLRFPRAYPEPRPLVLASLVIKVAFVGEGVASAIALYKL